MVKIKKYLEGLIPIIVSLAILVLFLSQPLAQAQQGAAPMTTQATTGQVTPVLNTNVTWSLFNSSMAPNEYLNGSGDPQYLNAEPSVYTPNYITVNPMNIQAPGILQNDTISGSTWQNASRWSAHGKLAPGEVQTIGLQNGQIYVTGNTSDSGSGNSEAWIPLTPSTMPSTSLQYDYFTFALKFSASDTVIGETANVLLANATGNNVILGNVITPGQVEYVSLPLSALPQSDQKYFTFNQNSWTIQINTNTPTSATASVTNASISGLAITEHPLYLGPNNNGTNTIERYNNTGTGTVALTHFSPDFAWSNITDNGYTESLSEPLGMAQNLTETQAAISSGQYIEEVTQQAIMSFPTAPDLTYGPSNMTLEMNGINASQVTLINVNGESYSSGLAGFNGTSFNIGSENPNSPNSVIIQIEYTAAQWNSFTSAPSFFSVAGIEYYWWIFIISTLGAVGLFAGLKSYATGKEETQRVVPPPRTR